ncbi:MAG: heme lyase CcmF/NrfE family subunit [Anaerolineales bacterium]|nr:heme lyase CcmF/NrfE family subunit [Anaerolineales bacterium]MDW8277628.1 heme lyase CcmF/NrfE family subunit [Anaerolineales bacterium]
MLADFGFGILLVTFLASLYSIVASLYGHLAHRPKWVESARLSMQLTFPLLTLASLTLIYLLVSGDFNVKFVYEVTSRDMPTYLKVTALWGGQSGSLLFWSWLMSAFATAVTLRKWERDREFLPWVTMVASITIAFFLGLNVFFENPFQRFWQTFQGVDAYTFRPANAIPFAPEDGRGLNPLLRHPGMVIHPPMLYLGFVAYVIPFAFAIAALITGRADDRWIRLTRRWSLTAWLFLSLGLVLGGRWAYDVLGWGGYWAWDPVEIAAFMPWLTGTAFLHSVMIQEKRGMLKRWNMILIILTYSLVVFGTFLTRSGVLSSVHAFAQSEIGPAFFIFIGVTLVASVALLIYRWDSLHAEGQMHSMFSREALFLLNNLLFMGILVICFWGVISPLITELVTGSKVTVGPPYYERAAGPLFALLVLLMGIAPLSAWGHITLKNLAAQNGLELEKRYALAIAKLLWKPAIPAVLVLIGLLAAGITNIYALIGLTFAALTASITLYEFWRAARARGRAQKEHFFLALWNLAGRNRRRYGGYIIHLGVILMAVGIIGIEMFQSETQRSLAVGESIQLAGYTVRYDSLAQFPANDGRWVTRAVVSVFDKNGQFLTELYPRYDVYSDGQPMTIPGVRSTLADDLYVLLINWEGVTSQIAPFKVYHNPLVNWLWLGAFVFIFGTLIAAWPEAEREPLPAQARKTKTVYQPGD